jgi:hypothetical protein
MKKLLIFSAGVALGCFLKKPKVQSQPKFVLVDDRASLGDIHLNPETLNKIREHLKNRNLDR